MSVTNTNSNYTTNSTILSEIYISKSSLGTFPQPLKSLQKPQYIDLNYLDLLDVCESTEIQITSEMSMAVKIETRLQSHSKLWYTHRAGRVTASRMKAICHTNVANPSQSLNKSVCYPKDFGFSRKQTSWGCKHERKARDMYIKIIKPKHKHH